MGRKGRYGYFLEPRNGKKANVSKIIQMCVSKLGKFVWLLEAQFCNCASSCASLAAQF